MNRFCAGLRFLLVAMMSLSFAESAFSEDNTLFYRGALDDKKAEAPNGAIANADYIDWSKNSAFGAGTVVHQPREGVWSISGYSIANYTFIEGKTGLIVFDTGNNIGMGQAALKIIREHSDKPISAIIYSHHHYTGGSTVFAEASKTGELPVYGHPDLEPDLKVSVAFQ
jgi:glyoxylase-like metal-dependent hydrolase (beta-lactamase superfamily II)